MLNDQELLFTVNEDNKPIEPQPRYLVHRDGVLHRTAHIWLYNHKGQVLCQQRSLLKDNSPGLWEPFFGGHLAPGQGYLDGALLELGEELGIKPTASELQEFTIYKHLIGNEFQGVFLYKWDGDAAGLVLEPDEVEQVKFMPVDEVLDVMKRLDPQWSIAGYSVDILTHIKGLS